jgi:hypothetical protein
MDALAAYNYSANWARLSVCIATEVAATVNDPSYAIGVCIPAMHLAGVDWATSALACVEAAAG